MIVHSEKTYKRTVISIPKPHNWMANYISFAYNKNKHKKCCYCNWQRYWYPHTNDQMEIWTDWGRGVMEKMSKCELFLFAGRLRFIGCWIETSWCYVFLWIQPPSPVIRLYHINAITTNFDSSGRIAVSCTRARYAFRQGKAMLPTTFSALGESLRGRILWACWCSWFGSLVLFLVSTSIDRFAVTFSGLGESLRFICFKFTNDLRFESLFFWSWKALAFSILPSPWRAQRPCVHAVVLAFAKRTQEGEWVAA